MQNLFQRCLKDIEEKNHGFEKSGALQLRILQNIELVRCILGKIGWQSLLHGQMNLNL